MAMVEHMRALSNRFRSLPIGLIAVAASWSHVPSHLHGEDFTNSLVQQQHDDVLVRAISLRGYGGEENWSSITVTPEGLPLVGMSSRSGSGVLLLVDPDSERVETVMRLEDVGHLLDSERQPKVHVTPVPDEAGWYHFVSHFGQETHLPLHGSRIGYEGMRRWRWRLHADTPAEEWSSEAEHLGRVMEAEGAVALSGSANGERLFVVTFPQAKLVEIKTDTGRVTDYGRVNGVYAPRHLLVDPRDRPYVLDHRGQFWTLDADQFHLRPTGTVLPVDPQFAGNLLAQGWVSAIANEDRSQWHAMSAWGRLYRISFESKGPPAVQDLGAPADAVADPSWHPAGRRPVTAAGLTRGEDGWFYLAISGYSKAADPSGDCHIIRYNPATGTCEQIARLDGDLVSYICGSGAVDSQTGRIFFVASHLIEDHPYLIVVETGQ